MNTKIKYSLLAILLGFLWVSCSPEATSDKLNLDDQKWIGISPNTLLISKDGKALTVDDKGREIEGEDVLTAYVTLNPKHRRNIEWSYKLADNNWCQVSEATLNTGGIVEKGLVFNTGVNIEYTRKTILTIETKDGQTADFEVIQKGYKADAKVETSLEKNEMEFLADQEDPIVFSFTSNMDVYDISVEDKVDWIHFTDLGDNKIAVTVDPNAQEDAPDRVGYLIIHVGTPETSEASVKVEIKQLAPDIYSFFWGSAVANNQTVDKAIKMNKDDVNIYSASTYIQNGKIIISNVNKEDVYPQYYLAEGGKLGVIESKETAITIPAIPTIDIDGMRVLKIDLANLTYSLERLSTANAMPDDELAKYKTKKYIASDGTMKEWMLSAVRWDGGNITPKLGGKLVPTAAAASGGYTAATLGTIDPAKEEAENGGALQGDDTHGRIYAFSEMLTGVPLGGRDLAINQPYPTGWQPGDKIIDAVGQEYIVNYVANAQMTGNNKTDESNNPTLTWQLQGICPYGWHIANAQDWLDLAYAMSQSAGSGEKYPVSASNVNYKNFTTSKTGIDNMAAWLRNNTHWSGEVIADGSDAFGFNYFPTGFRYLAQGWQMYGLRHQVWVPLLNENASKHQVYRIDVVINNNTSRYAQLVPVDNGNAILPFRCVKNYKK